MTVASISASVMGHPSFAFVVHERDEKPSAICCPSSHIHSITAYIYLSITSNCFSAIWCCGSVAAFCHRLTPGFAFLSPRFALGSWLALRSCRRVLPSAHGWLCVPVAAFCHRFTPVFFLLEEKETACDSLRSCSAGSRSPFARSRSALRLSALAGSLRVCAFLYGDPDGSTTGVRLYEKKRRHCVGASFAIDL